MLVGFTGTNVGDIPSLDNERMITSGNINIPSIDAEIQKFISEKLSSKLWRLSNLYYVKNKSEKIVKYVPNKAQRLVLSVKAKRKIVLKARQLGISTERLLYQLDECIFIPNSECGIISYGIEEAKKLVERAVLAWNMLDPAIKELIGVTIVAQNGTNGITFSNGSKFKVGNFRGDSLGNLHVSELAKIAAKYPDKAREIKTGAFEAVAINNSISVESTAEGKYGMFYEMWRQAERISPSQRTPLDFVPIFIGWYLDDDYVIDIPQPRTADDDRYFAKIEKLAGIKLTEQQKNFYMTKKNNLGKDVTREYPSFADEAFESHVEGVYYANVYRKINIIANYYPNIIDYSLPVHVASDIGMNDMFTMGFFQIKDGKPIIIDELSDSEQAIGYYLKLAESLAANRGWTLSKKIVVPHDTKQREFSTAQARYKTILKFGWRPIVLAKTPLADGIEITRNLLDGATIDNSCINILEALTNYRKTWNDKHNVFLDMPVHDNHSHWADMIRYMATAIYTNKITNNDLTESYDNDFNDSDGYAV